jgi:hypothetical protein
MSQTTTQFTSPASQVFATTTPPKAAPMPYVLSEDLLKTVGGGVSLPVGKW